ncbi:hypothetical protein OESDEN_24141 [Oesophagostomum dentatum]|uniref:SCP domain-containing protein n=1 Tax=Oesophagostomum dentatum TaxID=61180 RepID=A0A0B1RU67_OESDE|nr:hypothetical protein OESDEN_24141 [Oesophagostomum dentatum]
MYHDVAAHRKPEAEPRPQVASTEFSCPSEAMTDAEREVFLNFHNEARRRVAKGTEPNKVGTLRPAKNMYKLVSKTVVLIKTIFQFFRERL